MKDVSHALKPILRKAGKTIIDYGLIKDNDRIVVGVSGGKDSWTLLHALVELQKKAPVLFELCAVKVDYPHGRVENRIIEEACRDILPEFVLLETDIGEIIADNLNRNKSHCAFCARLRRGFLTTYATKNGFNKIALGHHREDFNETLLMNLFFSGTLSSMPVSYQIEGQPVEVIRPLAFCAEEEISVFVKQTDLPIIHSSCRFSDRGERTKMKELIEELTQCYPEIKGSLMAAQTNVLLSHLPILSK